MGYVPENRMSGANASPPGLCRYESSGRLMAAEVRLLDHQFSFLKAEQILAWAWKRYGKRAAIGTSFQGAGLVMIDLARKQNFNFPVFTLDTGLLFPETLALKQQLEKRYDIGIESLAPDLTLNQQEQAHGPNLWTRDPDLCCTMRKVLPLKNKLGELDCWITGLRRQQAESRAEIGIIEVYAFDEPAGRDILKLNPMANWTREEVWEYIRANRIPYNSLYDAGYRSIGCAPCTAKTCDSKNERAGRWLGFEKVECGIHTFMPRKIDFEI